MSGLFISVKHRGDVVVLTLQGKVSMGGGDPSLRAAIVDLVEKGHKKIVIDMDEVPYMDSTGLGQFVAGYMSAKRENSKIKLSNLGNKVQDMFGVVQLQGLFETFPNTEAAVKSFC